MRQNIDIAGEQYLTERQVQAHWKNAS